jgi:hypothetical protein
VNLLPTIRGVAGRLERHEEVAPRRRIAGEPGSTRDGYFYPREAATILGCPEIDYQQLRRLFVFARRQAGRPVPPGWARYTLQDLAAVRRALALSGGVVVLQTPGHRLQLARLERACDALREQGVENPLLDVSLQRRGHAVLASINGVLYDPVTGQTELGSAFTVTTEFLRRREVRDRKLMERLRSERRVLRHSKPRPPAAGSHEIGREPD